MMYVILGFLMITSMTKYDIKGALEKEVSPFYAPSYGSINHSIKKLLKEGFVTFVEKVEKGRNKKVYSITETGKEAFLDWLKEPIHDVSEGQLLITKMYFFGFIPDNEKKHVIETYYKALLETMDAFVSFESGFPMEQVDQHLESIVGWQMKTLDYGIMELETEKRFLEKLLKEFE